MTASDVRALVALVLPWFVALACLIAAACKVDLNVVTLVAGGALVAVDPRRGGTTTTVTPGDPPTVTTESSK